MKLMALIIISIKMDQCQQWMLEQDFLKGEVRFASLYKLFPERAEELLQKTEEFAKVRLETYKRLAGK